MALKHREHLGHFDRVVMSRGAQHPLGQRAVSAGACEVVVRSRRTGIESLIGAMGSVVPNKWTGEFAERNKAYLPACKIGEVEYEAGDKFIAARTCLKDVRQALLKPSRYNMPDDKGEPHLEFIIKALKGSCSTEWRENYKDNSKKDDKNTQRLLERYVSLQAGSASYMWLMEPSVWESIRVKWAGLFSVVPDAPYVFADNMTERPGGGGEEPYISLSDIATETGFLAAENVHILNVQSRALEVSLKSDILKARALLVSIAGIAGPDDSLVLPASAFAAINEALRVRGIVPFLFPVLRVINVCHVPGCWGDSQQEGGPHA